MILLVNLSYLKASSSSQPPNIVIIYADDLGWNDVSFHGSPQIPTPNIDALALSGITLQNYYGEWLCTPSRASLLTGKYPMRLGLQHLVILGGQASGLPLNETTMPQRFKKFGYETHMIGKWHLGYQTKEYTPTYRGFDSFFGYWNGLIDYYDHTYLEQSCSSLSQPFFGLDFHDNLEHVLDAQGKYATHVFTEKAEEVIMKHDTSKKFQEHDIEVWTINCQQRKEPPISRKIRSGARQRLCPASFEWGGLRRDSAQRDNGLPPCSKIIFSILSNE
ncbi:Arylsulfatase B [Araneus ventricosus]|uniref:Arylsulfatase B n=1 Tax=Araneus ventricosus TaxID=182803 RepID=A0A4Y2P5H3_ARAVE|nr:Arylsulfatase B [Araneus ventricosus]